jgi:hypothetical protein
MLKWISFPSHINIYQSKVHMLTVVTRNIWRANQPRDKILYSRLYEPYSQ